MHIVTNLFRLINLPAAHTGSTPRPLGALIDGATLSGDGGVHVGRSLLVLLGVELPEVALTVALLAAELVAPGGLAPGGLLTPAPRTLAAALASMLAEATMTFQWPLHRPLQPPCASFVQATSGASGST